MAHKGFVSLRTYSKGQRLAFVQALLHGARNTKEETKVSSEAYFGNFSLPSSQKDDTNSKDRRPSKRMSTDNNTQPEHKKRAASNSQPDSDVRLNYVAHWPEFLKEKRKYRYCKTGQSRVHCIKCDICLCLSGPKNCFVEYHLQICQIYELMKDVSGISYIHMMALLGYI